MEQSTSVVSIKDSVKDFVLKHLRNAKAHIGRNNKDEVSSLNILSNNNYQASSQKLRQIINDNLLIEKQIRKINQVFVPVIKMELIHNIIFNWSSFKEIWLVIYKTLFIYGSILNLWGTQWDQNSVAVVCQSSLLTIIKKQKASKSDVTM